MDGSGARKGHCGGGGTSNKPDILVGEDSEGEECIIQDAGKEAILPTNCIDTGHSCRTSWAGGVGEREDAIRGEHRG